MAKDVKKIASTTRKKMTGGKSKFASKTKSKKKKKKSCSSNSKDTKSLKIPMNNIMLNAFFAILWLIVDSFVCAQLRKVSINTWNMINSEFIGLKDLILSHYISNFSEKESTIYCKISSPLRKIVQVPSTLIDSDTNCSVLSKDSIDLSYNILGTVGQHDNSCTISEDFPVMDDDKPWILLGISWLDRAGWKPIAKWEFKLLYKVNPKNVRTYATVLGVRSGSVIGVWKAVESSVGKTEERLEEQINKTEGRINQQLNKTDEKLAAIIEGIAFKENSP
ncbi:hypothetical protein RhiirC2_768970 [Rhizophagus irregularis]|uniref:Uncharacterized protein n=1 Tax=Rhizophagus irregularis TaxID=588596 RepID=A0A2N1P0F3_9GLOM|nr:hypothetical protein RhiirC2_768970 [Rhizophagus irregularis]